jgi:hypothetical protein
MPIDLVDGDPFFWGVFLGFTLQTYLAARAFPLVIVLVLIAVMLRRWPLPPGFWRKSLASAALASVLAAPLAQLALQNPFVFSARAESVAVLRVSTAEEQLANFRKIVRMFVLEGSPDQRFNLPFRAVYDPALSILFLCGLMVTLLTVISPLRRRVGFPETWELPGVLLLSWTGVALLPTLLSDNAPHYLRSVGVAPAAATIAGLGAEALRLWTPRERRNFLVASLALLVVAGGWATASDYFGRWASLPTLPHAFDSHMLELADYMLEQSGDHPVSFGSLHRGNGTIRYVYATNGAQLPRFYELQHVFFGGDESSIFHSNSMEYLLIGKSGDAPERLPPWLSDGKPVPVRFPESCYRFACRLQ